MASKIQQISFLFSGERVILKPKLNGKFRIPSSRGTSRKNTVYRDVSAYVLVTHPKVKDGDPTLTLTSGEKIRVYQGGDSSQMTATAAGIIEIFDKGFRTASTRSSFLLGQQSFSDSYGDFYPWEDLELWN